MLRFGEVRILADRLDSAWFGSDWQSKLRHGGVWSGEVWILEVEMSKSIPLNKLLEVVDLLEKDVSAIPPAYHKWLRQTQVRIVADHEHLLPVLLKVDFYCTALPNAQDIQLKWDIVDAQNRESAQIHWKLYLPEAFMRCIPPADQVVVLVAYLTDIMKRQDKWKRRPNKNVFLSL